MVFLQSKTNQHAIFFKKIILIFWQNLFSVPQFHVPKICISSFKSP